MKKRIFIAFLSIFAVLGCILVLYLNSDYYYSKKLVNSIRSEDIVEIAQIISEKPSCINKYPSITSKWWHSAMNWRVLYPLNEACSTGNAEIIKLLIEKGADPNCNDGLTPLSITYTGKKDNWYEISVYLLENGADINYCTEYSGGKASVLRDIVQVRPGKNKAGYVSENVDDVMAAFNFAIENCDNECIDWTLALQHSVSNDRIEIVEYLLQNGYCGVNDSHSDMTALMVAARDSSLDMVVLLLENGADKSLKTSDGKTAHDFAVESNKTDVALLLSS